MESASRQIDPDAITTLLDRIEEDYWLAHQVIFPHRHQHGGVPVEHAPFQEELVEDFWSPDRYSQIKAFRGSGKSTLGEEDICLAICMRKFHNILIVGSNETRAVDRLEAIKHELATNDFLTQLFGDAKAGAGSWTQTKVVLWGGQYCIQAMGRDQDVRGIKHLDYRPDFVFVDDFESQESVQTPEQRIKTLRWFLASLLPACAPGVKVRIRATPMDAESVPERLEKEASWPTKTYPIEFINEKGEREAAWPGAFPLDWIDQQRRNYAALGELATWDREFMCQAVSDSETPFKKEMIRVNPREKTWHACFAMIDPARTVNNRSAFTGWAVWSWINNRLVVWAADAQILLPDEIVALGFDIAERFDPVWVGVELDGLEQFLLQPFRRGMVERGAYIPLKGLRAPRSKMDFIKGLQPFFHARECEFAQPLPALTEQLLNFPRGRIDAPNALAYALTMRPGLPIYESFSGAEHIVPDLAPDPVAPLFLAANASMSQTSAVLCQMREGQLLVLADWVREGSPAECVPPINEQAMLRVQDLKSGVRVSRDWSDMLKQAAPLPYVRARAPAWVVPQRHGEKYTNVGLLQAVRAIPADARQGGEEAQGKVRLSDLFQRVTRGMSAVAIAPDARWTLRALSGGYSRALVRGRLEDWAEEGPYRLLMEGIESFAALSRPGLEVAGEDGDTEQPVATDRFGRTYKTAWPQRSA